MKPFIFSTDSTTDLPQDYVTAHHIPVHPLHYLIDDKEYGAELGNDLTPEAFYQQIRGGKMPTTNATNPEYDYQLFEEAVKAGNDVLHLSFSSSMSSSYQNAVFAAEKIRKNYPEAKIIVIDTLSASGGVQYLIETGLHMQEEGKTMDEIAAWIKEELPHVLVHFTVPDLFHLQRGGRVKKSTAILGTALKFQPLMHIADDGSLQPISKVRGRAAALRGLAKEIGELAEDGKIPESVHITHGDCADEANELAQKIRDDYGIQNVTVNHLCPTLGAHTGIGCIVIGYRAKKR
ncbi:MAG: DegV family protein [Lachnospiraceae bacterium]|nr:DegV family protein [Lachnospiraceae bacterium]